MRERLGDLAGVRFAHDARSRAGRERAWDVVTCMEVLEHCIEPERRRVIGELARLVRAGRQRRSSACRSRAGPSLAGKQFFRALAGLRRSGRLRAPRALFAGRDAAVERRPARSRVPVEGHGADGPYSYYGHKGFEWRDARARDRRAALTIERGCFTPMPVLGPLLNSQAWFVCRRS